MLRYQSPHGVEDRCSSASSGLSKSFLHMGFGQESSTVCVDCIVASQMPHNARGSKCFAISSNWSAPKGRRQAGLGQNWASEGGPSKNGVAEGSAESMVIKSMRNSKRSQVGSNELCLENEPFKMTD